MEREEEPHGRGSAVGVVGMMASTKETRMPDISYSIRIVNEEGNGIASEEVSVHYEMTHDSDWTDDDGWVSFEKSNLVYDGVNVTVYFRGEELEKVWAEDGDTFSFTYSY